ncbi:MAG: hypothetical protein ABMA64_26790 [Myxococcota bacterium]
MRSVLWLLVLAGCKDEWFLRGGSDEKTDSDADSDADADADTDSDTDTDADADSDADSDADADADSDTDTDLDCDADYTTPPYGTALGVCITEEVGCGDVIYGTLEGGSTLYDYDYWLLVGELGSLLGDYEALDGPERVYGFRDGEIDQVVRVTFESCFDQWANWVLHGDVSEEMCDVASYHTAGVFEDGSGNTWSTDRLNPNGDYSFEFILEGLYGATGNYKMTVECF